tara:strand:- start:70550 stop:71629 length:1080 start_codon:yes stop_codon:yes gene_type:complete
MNKFLLICPIGFENSVLRELKLKGLTSSIAKQTLIKGGIEIECDLAFGLALNKELKCVSRILLRLKEQKCRDFPKLFQIISKFNFHPYLVQESAQFQISTQKSRIINTKKAAQTCEDALRKYFKGQNLKTDIKERYLHAPKQTIYIRIINDELTLSIDTTGVSSHIRGTKDVQGHAPIRETYASSLLMAIYDESMNSKTLVDPMCGSGTFLLEANSFYQAQDREFIYERFPLMHKLNNIEEPVDHKQKLFTNFLGLDRDESLLKERQDIDFQKADFFTDAIKLPENAIIMTNPPYGKRIKISEDRKDYFEKYINRLREINPKGQSYFIAPSEIPIKNKALFEFNNNGIRVKLYKISPQV